MAWKNLSMHNKCSYMYVVGCMLLGQSSTYYFVIIGGLYDIPMINVKSWEIIHQEIIPQNFRRPRLAG